MFVLLQIWIFLQMAIILMLSLRKNIQNLLKIDMVVCEFAYATSSFADLENHFLREVYTNTISEFAGHRQQSHM